MFATPSYIQKLRRFSSAFSGKTRTTPAEYPEMQPAAGETHRVLWQDIQQLSLFRSADLTTGQSYLEVELSDTIFRIPLGSPQIDRFLDACSQHLPTFDRNRATDLLQPAFGQASAVLYQQISQ